MEQLQRLNYQTFAEELGQYETNRDGVLVDRFHERNRYFVATEGAEVVGMISIHMEAPFSVEKRLPAGVAVEELAERPCEVRLLAISPKARRGVVLAGLFWRVFAEARQRERTHILISGVTGRAAMYEALGFRALGPAIAAGRTSYIPMSLDVRDAAMGRKAERFRSWWERRAEAREICLLPGPVPTSPRVKEAFRRAPMSHRDAVFTDIFELTRGRLRVIAGGMHVAVMTGSGTLANDTVAACLRSVYGDRRGLVLANGEFGGRLVRLARRAGLQAREMSWTWGEPWDREAIARELDGNGVAWVWGAHLETSTGMVNDLDWLCAHCRERGVAVAADCVSSLGAVPMPEGLFLASGVSGKSLGAYAGLCFVFAGEAALASVCGEDLPATMDIVQAMRTRGPMFTVPSPQLLALNAALEENYAEEACLFRRLAHYEALGRRVREELCARGCRPLTGEALRAGPIVTLQRPSAEVLGQIGEAGFRIAHESAYLQKQGWAQISVMGDLDFPTVEPVLEMLGARRVAEAIGG